MWAIMMAAMMLPTMVPTLRSYEDLMVSANGTRAGWLGVLLGYFIVWVAFAALITAVQLGLLFGGVVDMLGIAKSIWVSALLLGLYGARVCGRRDVTALDGPCHAVYDFGKTARRWAYCHKTCRGRFDPCGCYPARLGAPLTTGAYHGQRTCTV